MYQNSIPLLDYPSLCIYHILFSHTFITEHLGCFQLLAIMNNGAVNIGKQIPVQVLAFNSFVSIPTMLAFFFFPSTTEHRYCIFGKQNSIIPWSLYITSTWISASNKYSLIILFLNCIRLTILKRFYQFTFVLSSSLPLRILVFKLYGNKSYFHNKTGL